MVHRRWVRRYRLTGHGQPDALHPRPQSVLGLDLPDLARRRRPTMEARVAVSCRRVHYSPSSGVGAAVGENVSPAIVGAALHP